MPRLLEEFPPVRTEDWEAAIRTDLKGGDYDKRLVWRTDDGIAVKPYYRAGDVASIPPRTVRPDRKTNEWEVAQVPPENIAVDAGRFEETGATTVQELGFALAEGIEYVAAHRPVEMTFSFAIGSSYFFQIAKLRAFRIMWARVLEAFGADVKTVIHCRTSRWNKSIYDPHVNILRATTEAMSAAIGGADSITIAPFDATYRNPDTASERLALNTHAILQKEAYLERVPDPAAGSYYVEALTDALGAEAWKLMQRIEEFGGFAKAHDSGMVPAEIAVSRAKKETAVAYRRRVFVGVNQYPNLRERMLGKLEAHSGGDRERGPAIFEDIRLRTEASGKTPLFLLAEFGDLKMRKARSQFATNFFGCGGFGIETRHFGNIDDIVATPCDAIVLCSSDLEYDSLAADLIQALKAAGRETPVIVAGYPKDSIETLKAAGVADFIHIKSNCAETLARWQERLA
jgi:methylmalonyl-CoA mutase